MGIPTPFPTVGRGGIVTAPCIYRALVVVCTLRGIPDFMWFSADAH
jgi:hypothetical protein